MKTLNNLNLQHKCSTCKLHNESFFCDFSIPALEMFESLKITNGYPNGSSLFVQGQASNGIYMLCQGRVKLCTYSRDGKAIILRVAEAGEVLGLGAAVSDSVHEATAEVVEPCQVNFVRKNDFLRFLSQNSESGVKAVKQLSQNYHAAYTQIRLLALSNSVADKLARLFLEWSRSSNSASGGIHIRMTFTHEEIAEMIGSSRETVTRLLKDFKDRGLITVKGSDLHIHDRALLESTIGSRPKT